MKRKRMTFRLGWMIAMTLLCLGGFAVLGWLVFSPQRLFANLVGRQPVSIQSLLRANYAADDRLMVVAPIDMRLVGEVIRDQTTPRAGLPPASTGVPVGGIRTSTAGVVNPRSATPTAPANQTIAATLQTASATKPATPTPSPGATTLTRTPTRGNLTVTPSPGLAVTRTPSPTGQVPPSTQTSLPPTAASATSTVRPPTSTPSATLGTPSNTPRPSSTPTTGGYPPPQPTIPYP